MGRRKAGNADGNSGVQDDRHHAHASREFLEERKRQLQEKVRKHFLKANSRDVWEVQLAEKDARADLDRARRQR